MDSSLPKPGLCAIAVVLSLQIAASVDAQGQVPIDVEGQGRLNSVSVARGESLSLELRVRSFADAPLKITRAEPFLTCQGGWSISLKDMIAKEGRFFGSEPVLDPGGAYVYQLRYGFSTPISHYLLGLQLELPNGRRYDSLVQVPFTRSGFASPAALPLKAPIFIGLQEPIEVIELATGEVWLPIVGQLINTSGKALDMERWRLALRAETGAGQLSHDLTDTLPLKGATDSITEFYYGFTLPRTFRKGTLRLEANIEAGGEDLRVAREAAVSRVPSVAVRSPVRGKWTWRNGPGELAFHTHYHYPEQRYCYDLLIDRAANGRRSTFRGDPRKNESYYAWNQPILCAEDGKVLTVVDDVPDNLGNAANPANSPPRNGGIVVEHSGNHFSAYYHVRQGSAVVKVGQTVKAGDLLARVGNSGMSSEPHLHFGYMGVDRTGRCQNLPIRIAGLKFAGGRPAQGVPKGALDYVAEGGP
jgi:hypothetical protein